MVWGTPKTCASGPTCCEDRYELVATYVAKSGQSAEKIAELMSDETWLTAKEAKDLGLADEVLSPIKLAARADLGRWKHPPTALAEFSHPYR